ncbi:MAG: Crp/Fnr family transcriptional regulator [Leptospiraceae bacterium]|nr:Crp/Fnr family transcriptional regulator [Leptospiraceae bacterium]MBK7054292.1 Crp/Fnr family transcriptional regulator [Leptospiraceae bacterium]MBK9499586.1 Crp/Fnr family transcriptional regulator [Leptospiraceae bacterium]MBL0266194.1 Crp/Fnr family transcriptional regulator [Leptospiraceae bacterium]MBP9164165.1 Crp/Fnr family transcriptional regulator [Leptospiraceae bacterium]
MEANELLNKFVSTFSKDSIIFREGELATHIYFVKTGRVLLLKRINGTERIVGIINSGEIFGELALLDNSIRISTAKALEDSDIIKLDPKIVIELSSHNSEFMMNIFKGLAKRLVSLSDFLMDNLELGDLEFKVISRIVQYVQIKFTIEKYIVINMIELIEFLSGQFSIPEEKVSLLLNRLSQKNLLSIDNENVTILDLKLLLGYSN